MPEKDLDPENIRISKEKDFKISFTIDADSGGCSWEIKNLPGSELGNACAPINKDIEDEMGAHPISRLNTNEFEVETQKHKQKAEQSGGLFNRPKVAGFEGSMPEKKDSDKEKKIKGNIKKRLQEGQ